MGDILSKMRDDMALRGFSENTERLYLYVAGRYVEWLGGADPERAGEDRIRDFALGLVGSGLSPRTVNNYVAAVLFLHEVTLGRQVNRRQVPFMRRPKSLPRAFTRDQVAAILGAAGCTRDRAAISVAYGSGLRVSEVCRLRARDVDSASMRLRVEDGKGRRERLTLLPEATLGLLRDHWRASRPDHPEGWVFLNASRTSHVSPDALRAGLRRAVAAAGLPADAGSYHALRHGFATALLEDGCDLLTIKELMGHSSVSSTMVYLHVAAPARGAVASPMDGLRW